MDTFGGGDKFQRLIKDPCDLSGPNKTKTQRSEALSAPRLPPSFLFLSFLDSDPFSFWFFLAYFIALWKETQLTHPRLFYRNWHRVP